MPALFQVRFRWTCHRCAKTVTERAPEARHPWQPPGWNAVYTVSPPLGNIHGLDPVGVLCDTCTADLATWITTPPPAGV